MNAVRLLNTVALVFAISSPVFSQDVSQPLKEQIHTDEGTICIYERAEHREKILLPGGKECPLTLQNTLQNNH